MLKYLHYFLWILIIQGCEYGFEPPPYQKKIVVDGWIEPNQPARVILTFSAPFFEEIDSVAIRQLMLTTAKVTVNCDSVSEILMLTHDENFFPPYIYVSNLIRGKEGKIYELKVEYAGHKLTATTKIPGVTSLDSIWFEPLQHNDTLLTLWIAFNDKPSEKNYYRISARRNGIDNHYVPAYIPNLSDQLFNGQYTLLPVYKGNENPLFHEDMIYFNVNDTVRLKFSTVDSLTFRFWQSVQEEMTKNNNPFASTLVTIKSNIKGGLGIWAGYGTKIYQISYHR